MTLDLDWLRVLARYNAWMNDKLYALAGTLDDAARKRDQGAFFGSLHGTFNHLLLADRVWLARFRGEALPAELLGADGTLALDRELHADFDALHRARVATDEAIAAFVAGLTREALDGRIVFQRRGERVDVPLWWGLLHLFNHQTHHRGQATTLLMQQGVDPGVTDLFVMLRETEPPARPR